MREFPFEDRQPGQPPASLNRNVHKSAHSERAQRVCYTVRDLNIDDATRVAIGTSPDIADAINFADAARQGVYGQFMVPTDASQVNDLKLVLWLLGASAGTARIIITLKKLNGENSYSNAGTSKTFDETITTTVEEYTFDLSNIVDAFQPGDLVRINIERNASAAEDTVNANVRLGGWAIEYRRVLT